MTRISTPARRAFSSSLLAGALVLAGAMSVLPGHAAAVEAPEEVVTAQIPVAGSNIASGRAVMVVDKPLEEVLPVVLDYANYVQFMPNFTKSKVLAQRGSRAMVYMEVSLAKGMYTLYGQLKLSEKPQEGGSRIVVGQLMDGNIDAFDATFRLTPVDDGARTEIEFDLYVDPDIPLPSSVFSRENEKAAAKAVRALRTRIVDTPGDTA